MKNSRSVGARVRCRAVRTRRSFFRRPAAAAIAWGVALGSTQARGQARAVGVPQGCAGDVRLVAAAVAALDQAREERLDAVALREVAARNGSVAPSLRVWVGPGARDATPDAMQRWFSAQRVDPLLARCAVAGRGGRWALVVSPRSAEFRVELTASGEALAHARFTVPVRDARVVFLGPFGETVDGALDRVTPLPSAGAWTAQLVADGGDGPIPYARATLVLGAESTAPALASACTDVTDARSWLVALNRARLRDGALALRADPLLAAIALVRVRARAARATVAHALEPGDAPDAHLARERIVAARVAENIARAPTLCDAFERLAHSPSHRRVRAASELDAVGIATVRAEDGWYVLELFATAPAIAP